MQKIAPFLWFNNEAEEAVNFYTSIFKNSKITHVARYTESGSKAAHQPEGSVMTVAFEIEGQNFTAINGGPVFKFTPAISFIVNVTMEDEIEELWNQLSKNGSVLMPLDKYPFSNKYGWIQDRYGLSWQLILSDKAPQKIIPSLLFTKNVCGKAEEAIHFYTSIFDQSKTGGVMRYGANQQPDKEGTVMFADFVLEGEWFAAMDSAREHNFSFNEAISFVINCETQKEIDYYWEKLSESGDPNAQQCGWLKDKYGLSWQIVPAQLGELMSDPSRSERVMSAVLKMKKIDLKTLQEA